MDTGSIPFVFRLFVASGIANGNYAIRDYVARKVKVFSYRIHAVVERIASCPDSAQAKSLGSEKEVFGAGTHIVAPNAVGFGFGGSVGIVARCSSDGGVGAEDNNSSRLFEFLHIEVASEY